MQDEFSHTVLHKEKFNLMKQQMPRPVSAGMALIIEDLLVTSVGSYGSSLTGKAMVQGKTRCNRLFS